MNYLVAAIVALIAAALSYIALDQQTANKIKFLAAADKEENYESKNLSKTVIWIATTVLAVVSFLSALKIMDKVSDPINISKMLLILVCMVGAAGFDFREHRIPNFFPLVMAAGAVILLALGVILKQPGAVSYITTGAIAAVGCGVILLVASFLTKQGIGFGDIKLISAMALLSGIYALMGTLFFGVIACSIYAIVVLLLKKKKASSGVPFGPFLLFGYILTLFAITF